jgi:hypothetical protein
VRLRGMTLEFGRRRTCSGPSSTSTVSASRDASSCSHPAATCRPSRARRQSIAAGKRNNILADDPDAVAKAIDAMWKVMDSVTDDGQCHPSSARVTTALVQRMTVAGASA